MTTRTWNGSLGDFTDGANWSPTGAPGPGDVAIVLAGAPRIAGGTLDGFTLTLGSAADAPTLSIDASTIFGAGLVVQDAAGAIGYTTSLTGTLTNQGLIATSGSAVDLYQDTSAPSTFVNAGSVSVSGGGTLILNTTTVTNTGTIDVSGGVLQAGLGGGATFVGGAGTIAVSDGGSVELAGTVSGGTIRFADGASDTLILDAAGSFRDTIAGLRAGDTVDLAGVNTFGSPGTLAFAGGMLTVTVRGVQVAQLSLQGSYTTADFTQSSVAGDTIIGVACFAEGTRLATPDGARTVEDLREGDRVLTLDGRSAPVRWIGRRAYRLADVRDQERVLPVVIARDAIAPGIPCRDVRVSPEHTVLLDGCLVPARCLLNGTTITQPARGGVVRYFHVELDRHDIVLAEGMATESFLDTGNRGLFAGGSVRLHAAEAERLARAAWRERGCAPLLDGGPRLAWIVDGLSRRAGVTGAAGAGPGVTILADGRALRPSHAERGRVVVPLPRGTREVSVVSRIGYPGQATGDARRLGIRIERVRLDGLDIGLDNPRLAGGLYPLETDGSAAWRWTDGAAKLAVAGSSLLELRLESHDRYGVVRAAA